MPINYHTFFPEAPAGTIIRFVLQPSDTLTFEYLTTQDDESIWIDYRQTSGPVCKGFAEKFSLSPQGLALHQIRLEEGSYTLPEPFLWTPDLNAKETVEHLLPNSYRCHGDPPYPGETKWKLAREVAIPGWPGKVPALDISFYALSKQGTHILDITRIRLVEGEGMYRCEGRLCTWSYSYRRQEESA
jgi:hypothetical protein